MNKQWKKNAKDTYKQLKDLDPDTASKDEFVLYASCIAVLDHEEPEESTAPMIQESPYVPVAKPSSDKTLKEIIEDELSDAEMYYNMGERAVAMDELRHADLFLSKMKAQAMTNEDKAYIHDATMKRNQIAMKF